MKTLDQLKDEYADSRGFDTWKKLCSQFEPTEYVFNIIAEAYAQQSGVSRETVDKMLEALQERADTYKENYYSDGNSHDQDLIWQTSWAAIEEAISVVNQAIQQVEKELNTK